MLNRIIFKVTFKVSAASFFPTFNMQICMRFHLKLSMKMIQCDFIIRRHLSC